MYKELIDSNDVFFEQGILHAKSLNNFKFDLDYLTALRGKKVTIGEIISHSIPLNNLTDINNTVSKLLKIDFLKEIKNFNYKEIWNLTDVSQFKSNIGKIILSVEDNFKTRHILAHEFALNINLDKEKIFLDFANHKNFLLAADFVVEKIAGSYIPWYQQGMNRTVFDKYSKSKEELDSLIALLKEINEKPDKFPILGDIYLFNKSLENWEKFRTSYAECFAEEVKGGSLYPTIYYSVMQKQTDYLIKNLYDEFQITLRKYEIENKNLTRSTK